MDKPWYIRLSKARNEDLTVRAELVDKNTQAVLETKDIALGATAKFDTFEANTNNDLVFNMVSNKVMDGATIVFRPMNANDDHWGSGYYTSESAMYSTIFEVTDPAREGVSIIKNPTIKVPKQVTFEAHYRLVDSSAYKEGQDYKPTGNEKTIPETAVEYKVEKDSTTGLEKIVEVSDSSYDKKTADKKIVTALEGQIYTAQDYKKEFKDYKFVKRVAPETNRVVGEFKVGDKYVSPYFTGKGTNYASIATVHEIVDEDGKAKLSVYILDPNKADQILTAEDANAIVNSSAYRKVFETEDLDPGTWNKKAGAEQEIVFTGDKGTFKFTGKTLALGNESTGFYSIVPKTEPADLEAKYNIAGYMTVDGVKWGGQNSRLTNSESKALQDYYYYVAIPKDDTPPKQDPKKDVVKEVDGLSVDGEKEHAEGHNSITYNGENVFFKINGSKLVAGKDYVYTTDLVYKDVLDAKVEYVGVEESKAAHDIKLKDGSTIAKGASIAEYVTSSYDAATRTVTITISKDLLNKVIATEGFQYVGYIKATAIKGGTIANTFDEIINNNTETSNKVTVEVPTPKPEKHNYLEEDHTTNIDGKETTRGQVNYYKAKWDKTPFKGMLITSESAKTIQAYIDDYDESVVTPLVDQFKYTDAAGKEVNGLKLFHVLSGQEQNALVKKVLGMYADKGFAPKGNFLLWVVGADDAGNVDEAVVRDHVNAYNFNGTDIFLSLPMENKADAPTEQKYFNSVAQIDFSSAAIGNTVDNIIPTPEEPKKNPKKDVVKEVDGLSVDGEVTHAEGHNSITYKGENVYFKVAGSDLKAGKGYIYSTDLVYTDKLDTKVKYVGVEEAKASRDINLKDGSTIAKGDSIAKYVTSAYDEASRTVTITVAKYFLNRIDAEKGFQFIGYIKATALETGKVENTYDELVNNSTQTSNKVTVEVPTPKPEKHNYSDAAHKNNIDGKETLRGQVNHYYAEWDKTPFKGMLITSESAKTIQAYIDDYDETVVTPLVDQFKYKDSAGKEVNGLKLFHVLAGQEQNALVKKVLGMYAQIGFAPKGDFLLWVVGADDAGNVDEAVVRDHVNTYNKAGLDIWLDLPMQNKVDAPTDYRYPNTVHQIDFSSASVGNTVDNVIYKPTPKKDITKKVAGESVDGSTAKIGENVFFKVIGSVFKAERGYTFTEDLVYVDKLDSKVKYIGLEESKAPFDITLTDGTVIKEGESIAKYVTVGYDANSHTVYIAISKDFLNSISLKSQYQYVGYIKTEAIAPGKVENVIDEYINGVKGQTNKVTIEIPTPPTPPTPKEPKEPTPPHKKVLPETGETSSTVAVAAAVAAAVGALGLAVSKKKED